ncbi:MAG: purine-nucleoside phosphorylase [Acidobacteria bacterium]|nr:MAG: purine-nucleoside phosphorylase [Acidobacteriota bacterium]
MRSSSTLGFAEAEKAARFLARRWKGTPRIGIVLGSGLGGMAEQLAEPHRISYRAIPHFPIPTAAGHTGMVHWGQWNGVPVAILEGRLHLYEGWRPDQVAFPVRVLAQAGVRHFVLTCAVGGIARQAVPGSFMIFSDHLNFQGANVLAGVEEVRWGPRFVDLSEAYDPGLRALARQAARRLKVRCFEGVYACVLGPSYETPAEIRALRWLGADAVGMSTVPEVLALRALGRRVLALATITNRAAGLVMRPLTHEEVIRRARESARRLTGWLDVLVPRIVESASR